nr:MAG TPA: Head protein [Caudoviricetes sp.]
MKNNTPALSLNNADIMNAIRNAAGDQYKGAVPSVNAVHSAKEVGQVILGNPYLRNEFLNTLVNKIQFSIITSKVYNNPYADLKKGKINGTIEEIFVNVAKAREFRPDLSQARELQKSTADVRAAFHTVNFSAQYSATIDETELPRAFNNEGGLSSLSNKIIESMYTGSELDEQMLFQYLLIDAVTSGKMHVEAIGSNIKDVVKKTRSLAKDMEFISPRYNAEGVHTYTKLEDAYILTTPDMLADLDVELLAGIFNLSKGDIQQKVITIPNPEYFDNNRFAELIVGDRKQVREVTQAMIELFKKVKFILIDKEWVQMYDSIFEMRSTQVNSGLYTNYFLTVQKIVSSSPFSNAIAFIEGTTALPETVELTVDAVSGNGDLRVVTLNPVDKVSLFANAYRLEQKDTDTENGIVVGAHGEVTFSKPSTQTKLTLKIQGQTYIAQALLKPTDALGTKLTFTKG